MNLNDIKVKHIRWLIQGPSGVGKTMLAATAPKPIYFFDCDDGMLSIKASSLVSNDDKAGIEFDTYIDNIGMILKRIYQRGGKASSLPVVPLAAKRFMEKHNAFARMKDKLPYATIVYDSLTYIQKIFMNEIQSLNNSLGMVPTQSEYNSLIQTLDSFIQDLRSFPCHIILTAHDRLIKEEFTERILYKLSVIGKNMPGDVPTMFQESYRLEVAQTRTGKVRRLFTDGSNSFDAKSELGLPNPIDNPSLTDIVKTAREKGLIM